jgi:hypothetical protein
MSLFSLKKKWTVAGRKGTGPVDRTGTAKRDTGYGRKPRGIICNILLCLFVSGVLWIYEDDGDGNQRE